MVSNIIIMVKNHTERKSPEDTLFQLPARDLSCAPFLWITIATYDSHKLKITSWNGLLMVKGRKMPQVIVKYVGMKLKDTHMQ